MRNFFKSRTRLYRAHLRVRKTSGGILDVDSESTVRIINGRPVREIRSPEMLPVKFSGPALLTYPGVVLDTDSQSGLRIQK